jgi:hypothetical protein
MCCAIQCRRVIFEILHPARCAGMPWLVMEAATWSNELAARRCMQKLVPELKLLLQSVQAGWQIKSAEQQHLVVSTLMPAPNSSQQLVSLEMFTRPAC